MHKLSLIAAILLFLTGFKGENPVLLKFIEGNITSESIKLKVQFKVYEDSVTHLRYAKMNVPAQMVQDYPVTVVKYASDSVIFKMEGLVKASFAGKVVADSITGKWKQSGLEFGLNLKNAISHTRPQNPQKPFPYTEEEVVYTNMDKSIRYGATLTIPKGKTKIPSVILITGSGQQDRDETLFGHKPFLIIADYLTRNGIAVLRVDDRGIGKTTGDVRNATSKDFSTDVMAGIDFLKARTDINSSYIGLIGHSEGSMIALLTAGYNKDVSFIISLAGPGVNGKAIMLSQSTHGLKKMQFNDNSISKINELRSMIADVIGSEPDISTAKQRIMANLTIWMGNTDSLTKVGAGFIFQNGRWTSNGAAYDLYMSQMRSPWMKYFIAFDPKTALVNVNCPLLVLNGEKDMQVFCDLNISGFKSVAKDLKKTNMEFHQFPDLNHLFQHCKTGEMDEIAEIEETFSIEVLKKMSDWIHNTVKE